MEILLVGGQYDGEWVHVAGDESNPPMPTLSMPPKLEEFINWRIEDEKPKLVDDLLHYKLKRIETSNKKCHYEYHYQGR